jgi:flagellin-like hook-associated protein FlgL
MEIFNCPCKFSPASITRQQVLLGMANKTMDGTTQSSRENPDPRPRPGGPALSRNEASTILEARRSLELRTSQGHEDRFLKNIELAKRWLKVTHSVLAQLDHLFLRAKKMTIHVTDKACSPETLKRTAKEVEGLLAEILKTVDHQDTGGYPFRQNRTTPSYSSKGEREAARQGDGEEMELEIQPGLSMKLGGLDSDFLTKPLRTMGEDGDLNPGIDSHTRLSDLNLGKGVNLGSIRVNHPSRCWDIDLHGATTVGEVMDAISSSGIPGLSADINASKTAFLLSRNDSKESSSGQELSISQTSGGTSGNLGILTRPAEDQSSNLILTETTHTSVLRSGTGMVLGTVKFDLGDRETVIDLSSASTIGEIIHSINDSIPDIIASINNSKTGISVESKVAGKSLVISDGDGKKSAQALGISGSPDIKGALCFLVECLNKGEGKASLEALETLDLGLEKIRSHKAEAEAKLKRLESVQARLKGFQPDAFALFSEISRKDVSRAAAALGNQQSLLQSALKRGTAMIQPAFLDFIR